MLAMWNPSPCYSLSSLLFCFFPFFPSLFLSLSLSYDIHTFLSRTLGPQRFRDRRTSGAVSYGNPGPPPEASWTSGLLIAVKVNHGLVVFDDAKV